MRALDGVFQFANIAGPVVRQKQLARFVGDAANRSCGISVVALDEEIHQRKDVFFAIAQRRDEDRDDRQAIVKILAEVAFAHGFFQIAIGRGDDAHIHLHVAHAADAADDLVFQHAQQLGLQQRREFADFIEEQRAAVGHFEQALLHLPWRR